MSFVACLKDPINAAPAQYPDEFQGRTVALKIRQSVPLVPSGNSTTGESSAGIVISSSLFKFAIPFASTAGVVTAYGAVVSHDEYGTLLSNMKAYRPVSLGVRVVYTGSNDTSKGEVITYGAENNFLNALNPTTIAASDISAKFTDWRDYQGAVSVDVRTLGKGIFSAVSAFDRMPFLPLDTDVIELRKYFPELNLAISGVIQADAGFRVETYMNIECIPKPTSVHHDLARPSPQSPSAQAAARRLSSVRVGMRPPPMMAGASHHGITRGLGNTMGGMKRKRKTSYKKKKRKTLGRRKIRYAKTYNKSRR